MVDISKKPSLEEVRWQNIRSSVEKANPAFARIIDKIDPSDDFIFYKARYPFGSFIIDCDKFFLPHDGKLVPLTDPLISEEVQSRLGYNGGGIPLGFNLTHSSELYLESNGCFNPFSVLSQGSIFGLWVALQDTLCYSGIKMWNMVAGSRSLFVLPKITDQPSYKRLSKARGIKRPVPRNLQSHGLLLAEWAQHPDFPDPWFIEVLFFPRNWLEERSNEAWLNFWLFLYREAWKAEYWRTQFGYDYVWDGFVKEMYRQDVRITAWVADIIKHLMMVGLGALPGFSPTANDEEGPMESFKNDLVEIYGLKHFAPTIMVPKYLSPADKRFVYISLQYPTHFESTPRPRTVNSIVSDLREIMSLLQQFRRAVLDEKIRGVKGTQLFNFLQNARFDFFHSDLLPGDVIRPSAEMIEEDETLVKSGTRYGERGFSEISPFVRGCIRIGFTDWI